jgi:hypothetical protein
MHRGTWSDRASRASTTKTGGRGRRQTDRLTECRDAEEAPHGTLRARTTALRLARHRQETKDRPPATKTATETARRTQATPTAEREGGERLHDPTSRAQRTGRATWAIGRNDGGAAIWLTNGLDRNGRRRPRAQGEEQGQGATRCVGSSRGSHPSPPSLCPPRSLELSTRPERGGLTRRRRGGGGSSDARYICGESSRTLKNDSS